MTSTDPGDVSGLKGRRKRAATQRKTPSTPAPPDENAPVPLPDAHPNMTSALRRPAGLPVFDPRLVKTLAVAETGGHVPASRMSDYVVAAFDATEQVRPPRCLTPVTRVLWSKGQHVRRDVYQTFLDAHPELDQTTGLATITPTEALAGPEDTDPPEGGQGGGGPDDSGDEQGGSQQDGDEQGGDEQDTNGTGEPAHPADPAV